MGLEPLSVISYRILALPDRFNTATHHGGGHGPVSQHLSYYGRSAPTAVVACYTCGLFSGLFLSIIHGTGSGPVFFLFVRGLGWAAKTLDLNLETTPYLRGFGFGRWVLEWDEIVFDSPPFHPTVVRIVASKVCLKPELF